MRLEFARAGEHWMGAKKAYGTLGASRGGYHAFLNRPKSSRQIAREALEPFVGGHPLRRQSQIRTGTDRRRASQNRHCRERQDRAAHDDEEGAGILQGPRKHGRGGKASDKGANVLNGEFSARKRNSVWRGDIARMPTREGWPRLATYLDPSSRKIVEWQASPRINENLAIDALDNAVNGENQEEGLMVHTDGAANTPRAGFAGSSRIAGSSNRFPARAALTTTPSRGRSSRP